MLHFLEYFFVDELFRIFPGVLDPEYLNRNRKRIEAENGKFVRKLKKRFPPGIDGEVEELDEQVFAAIDCLNCANCCKSISPVFKERDIVRLSAHFNLRPSVFTDRYLYMDEEGDYVLKTTPCPFLEKDNRCSVYEQRPGACRSYPHTGTLPFSKSTALFIKNSAVCPAVHEIAVLLKKKYG